MRTLRMVCWAVAAAAAVALVVTATPVVVTAYGLWIGTTQHVQKEPSELYLKLERPVLRKGDQLRVILIDRDHGQAMGPMSVRAAVGWQDADLEIAVEGGKRFKN